ncbi:M48 family metalloprotease [Streptomyces himalayensis]|uniref:M48 family metalloprotease n=1 Tax=Streptomyces himalayensis subsp. himalayensis TaxID=2756131 RepID=A0A7W0IB63_9ACTN|nr:M48 family metallopeptidase [Streptomyces himalayensis]MBA2949068.1 M48 family metalloprotease [Streptomyces himalayensis subsp. himalayensis]
MGPTLRALRALVLLAGFQLLSLVLLAVLLAADWAAVVWAPASITLKVWIVSAVLAIPVVRGMFMLRTPKDEGQPGVRLSESGEPRLWALVRGLADASGTRGPDEIVLTGDVNAAVSERARLLGLLPGPRRLYLGLPLLTGLSEAQLKAVIAHEYGHFTGGDTRLAALVVRGRVQITRTIAHFHEKADSKVAKERARQEKSAAKRLAKGKSAKEINTAGAGVTYRMMAAVYTAYGKLALRATLSTARAQEYAADVTAARIAGRDATAAALRDIPALSAAHEFYLESYATLGLPARTLPPRGEFFGGFARMLTARELELAGMRTDLPTEPSSPYDSHPPMAERVRRIEAFSDDARAHEDKGSALALLTDPGTSATALEQAVLTDEVLAFAHAADWQDLLDKAMAARLAGLDTPLHRALALYTKAPATLWSLLQVIDDGQVWQLAKRLPLSDEAASATGRAFREFVRPLLMKSLETMVLAELSARGLLRWEFSWAEAATVHLPGSDVDGGTGADGAGTDAAHRFTAAVAAALADHPDTAPLRALTPPAPHETDTLR